VTAALTIVAAVVLVGVGVAAWVAWRRWLQLCPHCGWVVRRVAHGWLRCPRCHKQYARHAKLKPP
jgi:hypothetical protein